MSAHELTSRNISGIPSDEFWSQAFSSSHFFLTVVLKKKEEVNLAASGKQFLLRFEDLIQNNPLIVFPQFKSEIKKLLAESQDETIVSFSAGVIAEETLFIACWNATIFLRRDKAIKPVLKNTTQSLVFAQGKLENGDVVFFTSELFATILGADKDIITTLDTDEVIDEVVTLVHKNHSQEQYAITIAFFGKKAVEEVEQVIVPPIQEETSLHQVKEARHHKKFSFSFRRQIFSPALIHTFKQLVTGRTRMVLFCICILLGLIFITSIIVAFQKRHLSSQDITFQTAYASAKDKYDQGIALVNLNQTLSQKTLQDAKTITSNALPELADSYDKKKDLVTLDQQIDQALMKALKVVVVTNPTTFFDLTLIKDKATGSKMAFMGNTFFILDEKNKATYRVTTEKQSGLVGGNFSSPHLVSLSETNGYVLEDSGITQVSLAQKKQQKIIDKDSDWGDIVGLGSFSDTLYLLDKTKNTIHKYDSSHAKKTFFASEYSPDFSSAVSFVIDGSIWVLSSDGKVMKFTQGSPQDYTVSGLDIPFKNPTLITTEEEGKNIYVLDTGNNRVVSLSKEGLYQSQYRWEGMGGVTGMAVSEKDKKLYLLSGSKIISVDLSL